MFLLMTSQRALLLFSWKGEKQQFLTFFCCNPLYELNPHFPQLPIEFNASIFITVEFAYNGTSRGFQKTAVIDELTL